MDFGNWPREEQYINYLALRRKDDPIPLGVFTENPFRSNPWDSDASWYLFDGSTNKGHWEGDLRKTENGFWKWSSTVTIPAESTIGFKYVFEFYQGNPPVGTRTGWMMHQYHAGPKFEGASHLQDNISLCRLFWHNDQRVSSSRPNNFLTACAGFHTLGSDEKREADRNVPVNVSPDSFIEMKDLMSSDGEISEPYDNFLEKDYLNDILTSDTASTSYGNSSRISFNSEEYFNVDELLREIRDGPLPIENEEKVDCISSFTEPVQLHHVDRDRLLKGVPSSDKETSKPYHDFSNGDYLELRDLLPCNMASPCSGNLGCRGGCNSGEYFNADELLRDIGGDGNAYAEERQEKPNCRVGIKNFIHSSPAPLIGSESVASGTVKFEVADKNEQPVKQPNIVPEEGPSTSASSRTGQVKRNLSNRSEGVSSSSSDGSGSSNRSRNDGCSNRSGSKTPQSKRRKSIKTLAKIGKKFFCFF